MKVRFNLKVAGRPNKQGRKQIIARIHFDGNTVDIYTGFSAHEKTEWSSKKQEVKKIHPDYDHIDRRFTEIRQLVRELDDQSKILGVKLDPVEFKNRFKEKLPKTNSFKDIFNHWIKVMEVEMQHRTIQNYKTTLKFLEDFSSDFKVKLDIHQIGNDFFYQLQDYAYNTRKVEPNYYFSIIKVLKVFMKWAEGKYHNTQHYRKFQVKTYDKEIIYLEFDELMKLYGHPFTGKLCMARDLFCIMCFTGLRISDAVRLNPEHIQGDLIKIRTVKGNKDILIPINQYTSEILDRYNNEPPKLLPQKMNYYIKDCCRIVGINRLTEIESHQGGKPSRTIKPKYELITNHAARRTFITNSVKLKMHTKIIMEIVGHEKYSTMKKYLKIADETKTQAMKESWG